MVTRKALVRPIFRRVPHFPQGSKRTKHIARDVVRTLCERRIRDRRHTSQATSSRVKNWRKKCQPHKNDAIRFARDGYRMSSRAVGAIEIFVAARIARIASSAFPVRASPISRASVRGNFRVGEIPLPIAWIGRR
jgi:hypothetical protein